MDEQELTTLETLFFPLMLAAADEQGSRGAGEQGRKEYKVTFITAGHVRSRSGGNAPWRIPPETLQAAVGLLDSRAVFVDHPGWLDTSHSLRDLAGVTFGPTWNDQGQSIDGGIRLYSREDMAWVTELLDQVVTDQAAGREVPDVGLSIVFYGRHDYVDVGQTPGEEYERVTTEITHIESADLVFGPGAEGRLREALAAFERSRKLPGQARSFVNAGGRSAERSPNNVFSSGRSEVGSERSEFNQSVQTNGGYRAMDEDQVVEVTPPAPQRGEAGSAPAAAAPVAQPVTQPNPVDLLADQLQRVVEQVDRLTNILVGREETHLVQGMGQAPRSGVQLPNGRIHSMATGLDRFAPNVDWLFGVRDAALPDPQFRRADAIYRALTGDFEFRGVFDPERVMLASATTGTLANLAVNAMNKVIINQFANMDFWRWYERIVWVAPNDGSMHDMQWITFGGIGNLPTVNEGGAYTELTVDDAKESDSWVTKGGYVGITRKMILNSDIQRIQAVPVALAIACVRTRSAAVSEIFTQASGTGPTLDSDSTVLFHANHSNVGSTAFAQAEWRVVRAAIFKHTDVNSGKRLGVFPKYGLFPPDLYDSALATFGYGDGYPTSYTPETMDRGMGDPRPVPLVVPDWTDTNNWAAIVDPMVYPVIQMSYIQAPGGGQHPPCELFAAMDQNAGLLFSNDTLPIKVRDEFVVGVNGPRGVYKENVA